MAFPTTGILDNFNRANSTTTLGTNWSLLNNFFGTLSNNGISSNTAYNPEAAYTNYVAMYWNVSQYGADCEVYFTLSTKQGAESDNAAIYLRAKDVGSSTFDAYSVSADVDANTIRIERVDNAVSTLLGAAISQSVASGNKIGLEAVGTTLTAYINTAGTWSALGNRTDATYGAAGYLGMYIPSNANTLTGRWDDFGGGTIAGGAVAVSPKGYMTTNTGFWGA